MPIMRKPTIKTMPAAWTQPLAIISGRLSLICIEPPERAADQDFGWGRKVGTSSRIVAIANRTTSLNQSEVTHESRIGSGRPWDDAPLHLRYQMEHRPHAQWLGLTSSVAERLSGTLLDRRC